MTNTKLQSERVVVQSPLSFTGSAKRLWQVTDNTAIRVLVILPLIAMAWSFILSWYCFFGILVIPWRIFRRGSRQAKKQELQHRELLNELRG